MIAAFEAGMRLLRTAGSTTGARFIVISDGKERDRPFINETLHRVDFVLFVTGSSHEFETLSGRIVKVCRRSLHGEFLI